MLQVTAPIRFRRGYTALVLAEDGSPVASLIPVSYANLAKLGVALLRHDIEHPKAPVGTVAEAPKSIEELRRAAYAAVADHARDMQRDPTYARVARAEQRKAKDRMRDDARVCDYDRPDVGGLLDRG